MTLTYLWKVVKLAYQLRHLSAGHLRAWPETYPLGEHWPI